MAGAVSKWKRLILRQSHWGWGRKKYQPPSEGRLETFSPLNHGVPHAPALFDANHLSLPPPMGLVVILIVTANRFKVLYWHFSTKCNKPQRPFS